MLRDGWHEYDGETFFERLRAHKAAKAAKAKQLRASPVVDFNETLRQRHIAAEKQAFVDRVRNTSVDDFCEREGITRAEYDFKKLCAVRRRKAT